MKIEKTSLPGVLIITPDVFGDNRGFFMESYNYQKFKEIGIDTIFIQDNHSLSSNTGTLRGIHFQSKPMSQTKLVRCIRGEILDCIVDLRKDSPTFKKYELIEINETNFKQIYIPKGFGHAFLALTDKVEIQYKVDEYYSKTHDYSIRFDDPDLNIPWPKLNYILSEKDRNGKFLTEILDNLR